MQALYPALYNDACVYGIKQNITSVYDIDAKHFECVCYQGRTLFNLI